MKGSCSSGETLVSAAGRVSSAVTLTSALLKTARGKKTYHFMYFEQGIILHQLSMCAALASPPHIINLHDLVSIYRINFDSIIHVCHNYQNKIEIIQA